MQVSNIMQSGRLTRDPELKYSASGRAVCNFQIAFNKRWKGKDGTDKEKASFFPCTAFGKTAEVIHDHLKKGDEALFEGELEHQTWEKDGEKREIVKISVQRVHFVGSKRPINDSSDNATPSKRPSPEDLESEEVPF